MTYKLIVIDELASDTLLGLSIFTVIDIEISFDKCVLKVE